MNARPWPYLAALALLVASPLMAEQEEAGAREGGLRFVAPVELPGENLTASNPGPHHPLLLLALSHFDQGPQQAELEVFQPGLGEKLRLIVVDERVLLLARVRAISALGSLADEQSWELVKSIALDGEASHRLRVQALWAIGNRFDHRPDREPVLAQALREPDHGLRLHAVLSLARIGSETAMEIIDAHRIAERHVSVRSVLRELRETELRGELLLPREGLAPSGTRHSAATVPGRDGVGSPLRIEESSR